MPKWKEGLYEVEHIADDRITTGGLEYLIKWKGYPKSANTWEPVANVGSYWVQLYQKTQHKIPKSTLRKRLPTAQKRSPNENDASLANIPSPSKKSKQRRNSTARTLEDVRKQLHASIVPEQLPCRRLFADRRLSGCLYVCFTRPHSFVLERIQHIPLCTKDTEEEYSKIYQFIHQNLTNRQSRSIYISGVPGTGKTASVKQVIKELEETEVFEFIEVNGMRFSDPHQVFVTVYHKLIDDTSKRLGSLTAIRKLNKWFQNGDIKRKSVVLLVDELDMLCTRRQEILYQIFDWATWEDSRLSVIAIANTLDLPERLLNPRVASRLGMCRLQFKPYNFQQISEIVCSRMQCDCVDSDAVELMSRKVASVSGDLRKALEICRRSVDIAIAQKHDTLSMKTIQETMKAIGSSSRMQAIQKLSMQERLFLRSLTSVQLRTGLDEVRFSVVMQQYNELAQTVGVIALNVEQLLGVCARLGNTRLLVQGQGGSAFGRRLRIDLPLEDVNMALRMASERDASS